MEAEAVSVESICSSEQSTPFSDPQDFQSDYEDSQSDLIHLLLSQDMPIFKVMSPASAPPKGRYQQELLQHKILNYNRKEKSLEFLSQRFIQSFEKTNDITLLLQQVTEQLGVERRRMYDIINIFESLKMVGRESKNNYHWRGLKQAVKTITAIKQNPDSIPLAIKNKRQRSLQRLAGLFLRFFIQATQPITLDDAVAQMAEGKIESRHTKLRRLYDIVNVFKSLGLVEKVDIGTKKTGFRWLGVQGLERKAEEIKNKMSNQGVKKEQVETSDVEGKKKWKDEIRKQEKLKKKMEKLEEKKEQKAKLPRAKKVKVQNNLQKKENTQVLSNQSNINDWFSVEDRQVFSSLSLIQTFAKKKTFLPNIIQRETSSSTITVGSLENINDVSRQY